MAHAHNLAIYYFVLPLAFAKAVVVLLLYRIIGQMLGGYTPIHRLDAVNLNPLTAEVVRTVIVLLLAICPVTCLQERMLNRYFQPAAFKLGHRIICAFPSLLLLKCLVAAGIYQHCASYFVSCIPIEQLHMLSMSDIIPRLPTTTVCLLLAFYPVTWLHGWLLLHYFEPSEARLADIARFAT